MRQTIKVITVLLLLPLTLQAGVGQHSQLRNNGIEVTGERISRNTYRLEYRVNERELISYTDDTVIPTATRWVALGRDGNVSVRTLASQTGLLPRNLAISVNAQDTPLPSEVAVIGEEWIMRGVRFVPVTFNPVINTNGEENLLVAEAEIVVEISGSPVEWSRLGTTLQRMWGNLLINRDDPRRDQEQDNCAASYIYVIPDDQRISEIMQPLYDLRRLEGFYVVEMITPGNYAWLLENIRNIHEYRDYPVEYVCLVGDAGGSFSVPTCMRGTSDYPYGLLEGDDPLPESAVGRLSYNSIPELERIVDKILSYELEPDVDDVGWYRRAAVAAGNERSGFSTILVGRWLRDLMLRHNYTAVDTLWYTQRGSVADFMRRVFDRGSLFVNYRGWTGLEDWSHHDVLRLGNDHLPVALLLACNAGDFEGRGYGFTEALLRAEGGAIGAIGTVGFQARVNFNNALMAGYYRGVIEDDVCRLGWTLNRAKLEMFATYSAASMERMSDHAYWTNLMGDPGTVIWRGVPREVEIDLPEDVTVGDGGFTVRITTAQDEPVEGVRVGLYKRDEIMFAAYTDSDGEAELHFIPEGVSPGEASVTVSGDRVIPVTETIRIESSVHLLVYQSHYVIEDGWDPRVGNGDGTPNPGETIGVNVTMRNFGNQEIPAGVRFTLSTTENSCNILEREYVHDNPITPGASVEANFLVALEGNFPDEEPVYFTITASRGEDEWASSFSISGTGPRWEIASLFLSRDPQPEEWIQITLDLTNTGHEDILPFNAELISLNEYAEVQDANVQYDSLCVGDTVSAMINERFSLVLSGDMPYGIILPFEFRMISEDGYRGVIPYDMQVVPTPFFEPTGPDEYGYWAIDNRDFRSNLAVRYDWLEINPRRNGPGSDTGLMDRSEDDDKSVLLDLPFTFRYYGEEYNLLTVCTNGWAAFGDQHEYVDFRNLPIGSPQGPVSQLCPWWDDLYQPDAEGGVFYYDDEANHRFIVEWYRMRRWVGPAGPGARETFQLLLLDPLWHPTYTGDGDIIFKYQSIVHEARTDAHGTPYSTIGIGNPSDRGGLQYGFWNKWSPGAYPVPSTSTIRFSTSMQHVYSIVNGSVTTVRDNEIVRDATVRVTPGGWSITGDDGTYRIPTALAREQLQITVIKPGYNTVTRNLDPIQPGDSAAVNFGLTQPDILVDEEAFVDTLQDDEHAEFDFTISNMGDGELTFVMGFAPNEDMNGVRSLRKSTVRRDEPDEWESFFTIEATEATRDNRILGAVFTGEHFYVSGGNNGEPVNYIYRFNRAGQLIRTFEQPCRDLWGMHDLAYDSGTQRLYGGCGRWIYSMTLDGRDVDSIFSPIIPPRGLAVDPESGEIWVVNDGDPIHCLDAEGNVLGTVPHNLRPYGLAWRPDDPDDCPLYIFSADGETNLAISKLHPATGEIRQAAMLELEPGDRAGGCCLTIEWNGAYWTLVSVVQNPNGDRVELFNAGMNLSWVSVNPEAGAVDPDSQQECSLTISTVGLAAGDYTVDLVITHNAEDGEIRLPILMVYESEFAGIASDRPTSYELDNIYPNPSNGTGIVTFHLPLQGHVKITIIDQIGRTVADLVDGRFGAGSHRTNFNAYDKPSGIYFIRMETGKVVQTRKFVLLK